MNREISWIVLFLILVCHSLALKLIVNKLDNLTVKIEGSK